MVEHAQRRHAKYSGSNAARFFACTIQPDLVAALPPQRRRSTKYTDEGEKAHEVLHNCMEHGLRPQDIAPTEAIAFSVSIVLDFITALQADYPDLIIIPETELRFPQDVVPPEDAGGTPDLILYSPAARKVWVVDFKHGEGIVVEVGRNLQLWWYAASYCHDKPVAEIDLVVIQPRADHPQGPIRTETITAYDIVEFVAEVDAVLRGPKVLQAGPHCRWCPIVQTCEAAEARSLAYAREVFADVQSFDDLREMPDPESLGRARVGKILALAEDTLLPMLAAYREYAFSQARAGAWVPGWKTVEAQARRKWAGTPELIAGELMNLSGHQLGLDDVMPRKLITITDATERLAAIAAGTAPRGTKGAVKEQINERLALLTTKESSGNLTLVRDADRRPAINAPQQAMAGVSLPGDAVPVHAPQGVLAAPTPPGTIFPDGHGQAGTIDSETENRVNPPEQTGGYYIDAR